MKVTLDELNYDDDSYCALGACYRNLFGTFENKDKSKVINQCLNDTILQ